MTSSSARPGRCPATCTSCGGSATARATTSSTATRAWATRSPAALGVALADQTRDVFAMVGDGGYLMMPTELVVAVQERVKVVVVLVQNHGFHSIGSLSEGLGSQRFGTSYQFRSRDGRLDGGHLPVDLAANARSLGAHVIEVHDRAGLEAAIARGQGAAARRRPGRHPRRDRPAGALARAATRGGTCRWRRSPRSTARRSASADLHRGQEAPARLPAPRPRRPAEDRDAPCPARRGRRGRPHGQRPRRSGSPDAPRAPRSPA